MSYTGEDGRDVHIRLMDQLKPHWRRLAIALKFSQHEIAMMESKDDPMFYFFFDWLRGANQERDSRPVTWATLITALRLANVQEEANMLEKHFVQTESVPVAIMSQSGELNVLESIVGIPAVSLITLYQYSTGVPKLINVAVSSFCYFCLLLTYLQSLAQ